MLRPSHEPRPHLCTPGNPERRAGAATRPPTGRPPLGRVRRGCRPRVGGALADPGRISQSTRQRSLPETCTAGQPAKRTRPPGDELGSPTPETGGSQTLTASGAAGAQRADAAQRASEERGRWSRHAGRGLRREWLRNRQPERSHRPDVFAGAERSGTQRAAPDRTFR